MFKLILTVYLTVQVDTVRENQKVIFMYAFREMYKLFVCVLDNFFTILEKRPLSEREAKRSYGYPQ